MSRGITLLAPERVVEVAVGAEGPAVMIDQVGDEPRLVPLVEAYWTS